jgi:hypothetical protein
MPRKRITTFYNGIAYPFLKKKTLIVGCDAHEEELLELTKKINEITLSSGLEL